jgi:hypothetical protein
MQLPIQTKEGILLVERFAAAEARANTTISAVVSVTGGTPGRVIEEVLA